MPKMMACILVLDIVFEGDGGMGSRGQGAGGRGQGAGGEEDKGQGAGGKENLKIFSLSPFLPPTSSLSPAPCSLPPCLFHLSTYL